MPLIDVRCSLCYEQTEQFVRFYQEHNKKCEKCCQDSLERLISGGIHASIKNCTTLGQLAEINKKKAGKYADPIPERTQKQSSANTGGLPHINHPYKPANLDYYLLNATPEQKKKYIMTGIKPPPKTQKSKKEILSEVKELRKIK